MSAKDIISGPLSKVKRANRHIDELRQRTAPLDRTLYEITIEKGYPTVLHMQATKFQVTYRPKENIPETLAGIIGDSVGNLRAALDHLATGIVRKWGTPPPGPLYFPVTPRKDLVSHTGLAAIEQALPGSKKLLLDEIRPTNGPNEHFWDFYTLNKDDKHNFFIPTVAAVTVDKIDARFGRNFMNNCAVRFNAARPNTLISSDSPIAISNKFETTVEIKFGDGTPFKDDPVIPTLLQISEVVSETLKAFQKLMIETKPG